MTPTDLFYAFGFIYILKNIQDFLKLLSAKEEVENATSDIKKLMDDAMQLKKDMDSEKAMKLLTKSSAMAKKDSVPILISIASVAWVIGGLFSVDNLYFILLTTLSAVGMLFVFSKYHRIIALIGNPVCIFISSYIVYQHFFA